MELSKELLSEVFDVRVVKIYKADDGIYRFKRRVEEVDGCHLPNLHTLAYMCKKWAFKIGYFVETKALSSKLRSRESGAPVLYECFNENWDKGKPYDPICDIKVCEWIIENDENFTK